MGYLETGKYIAHYDEYCPDCIEKMKWEKRSEVSRSGLKVQAWFLVCRKCGFNRKRMYHTPETRRKRKKRR